MLSMGRLIELRSMAANAGKVEIQASELVELIELFTVERKKAQIMCDTFGVLGVTPPETPRPDFGSSFAGGSAYEYRAQQDWDAKLRTSLRGRI